MTDFQATDLAYAAGYFDGEGSLALFYMQVSRTGEWRKNFRTSIGSSDCATLTWFQGLFGGYLARRSSGSWTKKQMYGWQTVGNGTYTFVVAILPYLKYKHEHATFCASAWEKRSSTEDFIKACAERKRRWGRATETGQGGE